MKPDPLSLSRWWRALKSHYPEPSTVVLRCHNWGQTFEVRSSDLEALTILLESHTSPGSVSPSPSKPGIPEPTKDSHGL